MLLLHIVTPSLNTAQIFFGIAFIVFAIAVLVPVVARDSAPAYASPGLVALGLLFVALGLLWAP
jgi:hypothetical protein